MTKADKKILQHKIGWEGFDYAFTSYSNWEEITDEEFQKLRQEFVTARKAFIDFLKKNKIDVDQ